MNPDAGVEGWSAYLLKKRSGPTEIDYLPGRVIEASRHAEVCPELWTEVPQWQEDHASLWEKWKTLVDVSGEGRAWSDFAAVE